MLRRIIHRGDTEHAEFGELIVKNSFLSVLCASAVRFLSITSTLIHIQAVKLGGIVSQYLVDHPGIDLAVFLQFRQR